MKILPVFLLLLLSLPNLSFGYIRSHATPINATSPEWLSLLRYKKSILSYESEVDSKQYFLHSEGKTNPWLEYLETKKQITKSKDILCQFPARAILMLRFKEINKVDFTNCKKYQEFYKKLNLKSVSIIFSGYYINKPASAFGHTFFRLRSGEADKTNNDLLDFGVDFSADVDTDNPLIYGIKGIFGGFGSRYKLMPYYVKVREYNDMESRELWDYELNLSKEEIKYFVAHLFEMNKAFFYYYYFSENCSYHILNFVNAIKPEWKTMETLNWFVPPVQTIQALYNQKNIVRKIKYLPAQNKKFYKRYNNFSKNDQKLIKRIIDSDDFEKLNELNQIQQALMTDALIDYYDYIDAEILLNRNAKGHLKAAKRKFELNVIRSKNSEKPVQLDFSNYFPQAPHNSHKTKRIKLGYLNQDSLDGIDFEMRFSFHDYMDNQISFIPFSRSVLGRFNFKYFEDQKIMLDQFSLVNVDAFRPMLALEKNFSWRINFGTLDNRFTPVQEFNPFFDLSLGATLRFNNFIIASFVKTQQLYQTRISKGFTSSVGPELLAVYNNDRFAISSEYTRLLTFTPRKGYATRINNKFRLYFSKNTSLYISHEYQSKLKDVFMGGLAINF